MEEGGGGGANGEGLKRKENMVEQKEKPRRAVTKLMGRNLRKMENAKRGDNAIRGVDKILWGRKKGISIVRERKIHRREARRGEIE